MKGVILLLFFLFICTTSGKKSWRKDCQGVQGSILLRSGCFLPYHMEDFKIEKVTEKAKRNLEAMDQKLPFFVSLKSREDLNSLRVHLQTIFGQDFEKSKDTGIRFVSQNNYLVYLKLEDALQVRQWDFVENVHQMLPEMKKDSDEVISSMKRDQNIDQNNLQTRINYRVFFFGTIDQNLWQEKLSEIVGERIQVHLMSEEQILVNLPIENQREALVWMQQQNQIFWMERVSKIKLHDMFMDKITKPNLDQFYSETLNTYLDGTNQVIAIADTGLEGKSCYFFDQKVYSPSHRKIVSYDTINDLTCIVEYGKESCKSDLYDSQGHGTQVSSVISGKFWKETSSLRRYNGVAPESKIAFFDMQTSNGVLSDISDLDRLFDKAYQRGARIMTNSWGDNENFYGHTSHLVDKFTWENPDFLILFSAGNEGIGKLSSSSNSKNCISVGSSMVGEEGYDKYLEIKRKSGEKECAQGPYNLIQTKCKIGDQMCTSFLTYACQKNYREACRDEYSDYHCKLDVCKKGTDSILMLDEKSSTGPTLDGRTKPDIVAPGSQVIVSKNEQSDGCLNVDESKYVTVERGSSFSTPHVAGLAALIRQYLEEDPLARSGRSSFEEPILNPTSALIKALLIQSAYPLTVANQEMFQGTVIEGFTQGRFPQGKNPVPRFVQGYGKPNITKLLFDSDSEFDLYYYDDVVSTDFSVCFHHEEEESPIRVTLVYTDYPADFYAYSTLINDLDVMVTVMENYNFKTYSVLDKVNNVEQVEFEFDPSIHNNWVKVSVTREYEYIQQPFALVISGKMRRLEDCKEPEDFETYLLYVFLPIGGVAVSGGVGFIAYKMKPKYKKFEDEGQNMEESQTEPSDV